MRLNGWYISPSDERCYPFDDKGNRVKYISWFPWPGAKAKILDFDKELWEKFLFVSSGINYSHDCIKAIFR
jgi:hypothetical protein